MKTYGEALSDPTTILAQNMAKAQSVMQQNEQIIRQWMATGLTREEAWKKALA